jgi:hypothetical protein
MRTVVTVRAVTNDKQCTQREDQLKGHVQVAPAVEGEDTNELQGKDVEPTPSTHIPA